ncbi:AAA family ATPase [Lactobacillus delbrueckii]|uniref:AAA family ATPase n=1 Tax=Lactobacillus delbrueckii TaxID=1584 RepID=UPI001E4A9CEB|nr:ATP-binding protein [Lactobacillus delbrueckii]
MENLARFSDAIHAYEEPSYLDGPNFTSFEQAFKYLVHLSEKNDRLILVIDKFPYLAKAYPPISSMLQSYIDHYFKQKKLFLILCGSSMSFMEKQVLGYKSPLYGRRTAQFKLKPFSLHDAEEFFPQLNKEEVFELNAITGGIPLYLSLMSPKKSLRENIKDNFLTTSAMLYAEPMSLLNQELREPASYSSIISAIASGASRQSEISAKTGIASGALTWTI